MQLNRTQVEAAAGWLQVTLVKEWERVELEEAKRKALQGVVPNDELPTVVSDLHNVAFLQELLQGATESATELSQSTGEVARLQQELKALQGQLSTAEKRFSRLQGQLRKLLKDSTELPRGIEPPLVTRPLDQTHFNPERLGGGQSIGG